MTATCNTTEAVRLVRDMRAAMERDQLRQEWTFTRDEVALILAAIDYATEEE